MPGVRQELGPGDQSQRQEKSTSHGGGDGVEITASGDPDQPRMDDSLSGGAASSSGQGLKRSAGQAGLPEDEDTSCPRGTKRTGLESTGSGTEPDARRQKVVEQTDSTTRNDADFDIQVTEVNIVVIRGPVKRVEFGILSVLARRATHSTRSGSGRISE